MPWLADLVQSSESSLNVLPSQCLCEFLLMKDEKAKPLKRPHSSHETKVLILSSTASLPIFLHTVKCPTQSLSNAIEPLIEVSFETIESLIEVSFDTIESLIEVSFDTIESLIEVSFDTIESLIEVSFDTIESLIGVSFDTT